MPTSTSPRDVSMQPLKTLTSWRLTGIKALFLQDLKQKQKLNILLFCFYRTKVTLEVDWSAIAHAEYESHFAWANFGRFSMRLQERTIMKWFAIIFCCNSGRELCFALWHFWPLSNTINRKSYNSRIDWTLQQESGSWDIVAVALYLGVMLNYFLYRVAYENQIKVF